jgi:inosine-uridine nucleoside N-ribohydrolase
MMGGVFGLNGNQANGNMGDAEPSAPQSEFNVYIDPSAARRIFASVPNIVTVPLNACSMVPIDDRFISDFEAISSDSPRTVLAKAVFDRISADNNEIIKSGQYFAWDPLTVVGSALRAYASMTVNVDDLGVTSSPGSGPVTIALAADPAEFRSAFFKGFS